MAEGVVHGKYLHSLLSPLLYSRITLAHRGLHCDEGCVLCDSGKMKWRAHSVSLLTPTNSLLPHGVQLERGSPDLVHSVEDEL